MVSNKNSMVYVLGIDYEVKEMIPWTEAVTHILKGTMTPFKVHPTRRVRSAGGTVDMAMPEMVRLNYWVKTPRPKTVDLDSRATRQEILRRDGRTCGYCGEYADTVDHIIPESVCKRKKYPHNGWVFKNLVASCKDCNNFKANRTPEEAGMKLLWTPHVGNDYYSGVQKEVWRILETGDGYFSDVVPAEGILTRM